MKKITVVFLLMMGTWKTHASAPKDSIWVYKKIDTLSLSMLILSPDQPKANMPAIIFFFGGGWNSGTRTQFLEQAQYFREKGMVCALADYRVKSRNQTSPLECLKDAKSAIRFLREHANTLGIDPNRIVAAGGSAGGHLAAATFTEKTIEESSDDKTVSCTPNALALFNPVIDNGPEGYGYERVSHVFPAFSPMHNIRKGFPPTIFFLGTEDTLIPVKTGELFRDKIQAAGGRCDLFLYEGQGHGFFNKKKNDDTYFNKTLLEMEKFLHSLGYLNN